MASPSPWKAAFVALDVLLSRHIAPALLNHVGQLVRKQLPARRAFGTVSPRAEKNVLTGSECYSVERAAERSRLLVCVHSDAAKVGAKRGFHLGTNSLVERLSAASLPLDCGFHIRGHFIFAGRTPG